MKKNSTKNRNGARQDVDRDTMRAEYDFSRGRRGVTAARYREGTNLVLLDPDVQAMFPDSTAVNEAVRTLARVVRARANTRQRRKRSKPRR